MTDGINLLAKKEQPQETRTKKKLSSILRVISIILLIAVSLITVVVFFLKIFSPLPKLKQEEQQLQSKVNTLLTKKVKHSEVGNRLNGISTHLEERNRFDTLLEEIVKKGSDDIHFSEIKVDGKSSVEITVVSQSLGTINSFMENLIQATQDETLFSVVNLTNLSKDINSNVYSFSLQADLL